LYNYFFNKRYEGQTTNFSNKFENDNLGRTV
jgi:hypothetical protein